MGREIQDRKRGPNEQKLVLLGSGESNRADVQTFRLKPLKDGGRDAAAVNKAINGSPSSWANFSDASFSVEESSTLIPSGQISSDAVPPGVSTETTESETSGEQHGKARKGKHKKSNSRKSLFSRSKDPETKPPPRRVSRLWKKVTNTGKTSKKDKIKEAESQLVHEDKAPSSTTSAQQKAMIRAKNHQRKVRGRLGIEERIDVFEPILQMNFPDAETLKRRRRIRASGYRDDNEVIQQQTRAEQTRKQSARGQAESSGHPTTISHHEPLRTRDEQNNERCEKRPLAPRNNREALRSSEQQDVTTDTSPPRIRDERRPLGSRNHIDPAPELQRATISTPPQAISDERVPNNNDLGPTPSNEQENRRDREPASEAIPTFNQRLGINSKRVGLGIEPQFDVFDPKPVGRRFSEEEEFDSQRGRRRVYPRDEGTVIGRDAPLTAPASGNDMLWSDHDFLPPFPQSNDTEILDEIVKNYSGPPFDDEDVIEAPPSDGNQTARKTNEWQRTRTETQLHEQQFNPTPNQHDHVENGRTVNADPERALLTNVREASHKANDAEEIDRLLAMLDPLTNGPKKVRQQTREPFESRVAHYSHAIDQLSEMDPQGRATSPIPTIPSVASDLPLLLSEQKERQRSLHSTEENNESLLQRAYASGPIRKYWKAYSNVRSRGSFDSASFSDEFRDGRSGNCNSRTLSTESAKLKMAAAENQDSFLPPSSETFRGNAVVNPMERSTAVRRQDPKTSLSGRNAISEVQFQTYQNARSQPPFSNNEDLGTKQRRNQQETSREGELSNDREEYHQTSAPPPPSFANTAPRIRREALMTSNKDEHNQNTADHAESVTGDQETDGGATKLEERDVQSRLTSKLPKRRDPPYAQPLDRAVDKRDPPEMKTMAIENDFEDEQRIASNGSRSSSIDSNDFNVDTLKMKSNANTHTRTREDSVMYSDESESSSRGEYPLSDESLSDPKDFEAKGSFDSFRKSVRQRQIAMTGLDATIYTISERDSKSTVSTSEKSSPSSRDRLESKHSFRSEIHPSFDSESHHRSHLPRHRTGGAGPGAFTEPADSVASRFFGGSVEKSSSDSITNMSSPASDPASIYDDENRRLNYNGNVKANTRRDEVGIDGETSYDSYSPETVYGNGPDARSVNSANTEYALSGSSMPILPPRSFDAADEDDYPAMLKRGSFDSISYVTEPASSGDRTACAESDSNCTPAYLEEADSNSTTGGKASLCSQYGESQMFRFERSEMRNPDPPVYRKTLPPPLRETLILSMSPMVESDTFDTSEMSSYDESTFAGTRTDGCPRADACGFFAPVCDVVSRIQEKIGANRNC